MMQAKHIPDTVVVELARQWHDTHEGLGVVEALIQCGVPEKLAYYKVERLTERGILDYGTSPRYAWPA